MSSKESESAIGRVYPRVVKGFAGVTLVVVIALFLFVPPRFQWAIVDPIPERMDVEEVCRIDGKWLTPHGPGNHPLAAAASRFALLGDRSQANWLLDSTNCALREVKLLPKTSGRVEAVTVSDLEVVFVVLGEVDLPVELIRLDLVTGETKSTLLPQRREEALHLRFSKDGRRAFWITGFLTDEERVHGAPIGDRQPEFSFAPGARLGPYYMFDVSGSGREVLLQRDRGEYLLVDTSGALIRTLRPNEGIQPFGENIRFAPDGGAYLTWDNDWQPLRSVVQWHTADRTVRKELPDESSVVSAAASSAWNWVAASIQANTKSGRGIESLTVWSADGTVRYHKRLRNGARTPVVFLAGDLVAYTEVDAKWHGTTRILRLSRTTATSGVH